MSASGSDPNSVSGARRARVAVVGGGIAGLTAASHLARAGCDVVVYETGRGPGGRTSTRRGGPERPEAVAEVGAEADVGDGRAHPSGVTRTVTSTAAPPA